MPHGVLSAAIFLCCLSQVDGRVVLTHECQFRDWANLGWRGISLSQLTADASRNVNIPVVGQAHLQCTFDARAPQAMDAKLSGAILQRGLLHLRYAILHRLAARQTAYKLTGAVSGRVGRLELIAATPFCEGGAPSLVGGPLRLVEANAARSLGADCRVEAACVLRGSRSLRLTIERALPSGANVDAEVTYDASEGAQGAASCELGVATTLAPGRTLRAAASATPPSGRRFGFASPSVTAVYADRALEHGATWIARASASAERPARVALVRRYVF